jgi:AcrR family transcriptional regulator
MNRPRRAASARPARRRKLPRAERELQMLEIAGRVFGQRGYHATSMDEIARACGVTKPMLYAYFRSKEGLFLAVVDRTGKTLVSSVEKLLVEPDPRKRLIKGADLILDFIARDRHAWAVMYAEGLGDSDVARHVAGYRNRIVQLTALTLGQARPVSLATAAGRRAAELYAVSLIGAGEAVARWWLDRQNLTTEELLAMTRAVVDALLAAFLAGTGAGAARREPVGA